MRLSPSLAVSVAAVRAVGNYAATIGPGSSRVSSTASSRRFGRPDLGERALGLLRQIAKVRFGEAFPQPGRCPFEHFQALSDQPLDGL